MLEAIRYRGVLIGDAGVDGERKADHAVPNVASGVRLSATRWLVAHNTADMRGCDANRSILYQIRSDAPDGPIVRRGVFARPDDDLDPLGVGRRFWRGCSTPKVFGVPKGATRHGRPLPHANRFVLVFSTKVRMAHEGRLIQPLVKADWPEDVPAEWWRRTQTVLSPVRQIVQFRLNGAEDDIEILAPRRDLRQVGFDGEADHCRHGPGLMVEPWCEPVPANADATDWIETSCYNPSSEDIVHNARGRALVTIRFAWNPTTGLYEWTETGDLVHQPPDVHPMEPSLSPTDDGDWIVTIRTYDDGGVTRWCRTDDPFRRLGPATIAPDTYGQRVAARCPDGGLRIFLNDQNRSPYHDKRNPLYCCDVDPHTFEYTQRDVVWDARAAGAPFQVPFIDHVCLLPPLGNRQLLPFRAITARQIWNAGSAHPPLRPDEVAGSGIHYAELVYDRDAQPRWTFEPAGPEAGRDPDRRP